MTVPKLTESPPLLIQRVKGKIILDSWNQIRDFISSNDYQYFRFTKNSVASTKKLA